MSSFFGADQVALVKRRIESLAVYGEYLDLRRSGGHQVACCPWHGERTPSLHVHDDGHHHCYGCGAHGDVIDLVQLKESCDFQAAVEILARKAGVTLEDLAQATPQQRERTDRILHALEFAASVYERDLDTVTGNPARIYLTEDRRLTDVTIRTFRMGWANGGDALLVAALDAGIAAEDLVAADLVMKAKSGELRDRFFRRVVVPIIDTSRRVIGFTARALPADEIEAKQKNRTCPKYVNTAETEVFKKGASVFNLRTAASAAKIRHRVLVLEGALDVIAAAQAGFPECVAPLGTAFTADQAAAIMRAARNTDVIVALDGDQAGQKASERTARLLLTAGAPAKIAALPDDMDPAEALVEAATAETKQAFADAVTKATPVLPWLLDRLAADLRDDDQPARLRVLDEIIGLIHAIPDTELSDLYLTQTAKLLKIDRPIARRRLSDAVLAAANAQAEADERSKPRAPAKPEEPAPVFFETNEHGNALRFQARYGKDVVYCETWGTFLTWTGTHWQVDENGLQVDRMMVATIDSIADEIQTAHSPDRRDELIAWRRKNKNDRPLQNSVNRLRSLLTINAAQLDTDPWKLTCTNGTLDLRTGELRPHDRTDYITRTADIVYDPAARDAKWLSYLHSLTGSDPSLMAFLRRVAGYCSTGLSKTQATFMLAGIGGSGKSTFVQALMAVLGGYARAIPFELFLAKNSDKRKWSLAEASQCRLIVCEESEEGQRFNAALIKSVSGGTKIEAERKGGHPFEYKPLFKVMFVCNDAPYVSDTDSGFWRRMYLVKCDHLPTKRDEDLQPYLCESPAARAAILAWMVAGAVEYAERGLDPPEIVRNASQAYRDDQDPLREMLEELFVITEEESHSISKADFYREYKGWCDRNGKKPISTKGVGQRLSKRGVTLDRWDRQVIDGHSKSVSAYGGIRLRGPGDDARALPGSPANDSRPGSLAGRQTAADAPLDLIDDSQFSTAQQPIFPASQRSANDMPTIIPPIVGGTNAVTQADLAQHANDPTMAGAHAYTRNHSNFPLSSQGGKDCEGIVGETDPTVGPPLIPLPPPGTDDLTGRRRFAGPPTESEDLFRTTPPREPGADEDEPPFLDH